MANLFKTLDIEALANTSETSNSSALTNEPKSLNLSVWLMNLRRQPVKQFAWNTEFLALPNVSETLNCKVLREVPETSHSTVFAIKQTQNKELNKELRALVNNPETKNNKSFGIKDIKKGEKPSLGE